MTSVSTSASIGENLLTLHPRCVHKINKISFTRGVKLALLRLASLSFSITQIGLRALLVWKTVNRSPSPDKYVSACNTRLIFASPSAPLDCSSQHLKIPSQWSQVHTTHYPNTIPKCPTQHQQPEFLDYARSYYEGESASPSTVPARC